MRMFFLPFRFADPVLTRLYVAVTRGNYLVDDLFLMSGGYLVGDTGLEPVTPAM